jgi:hypothetical protein
MQLTNRRDFYVTAIGVFILSSALAGCSQRTEEPTGVDNGQQPKALTSYSQELTSDTQELKGVPSQTLFVDVTAKNTGGELWRSGALHPTDKGGWVDLSYRWYDSDGKVLQIEGERTHLTGEGLLPGTSAVLKMKVIAPPAPGTYKLWVSMVQEGFAWFYTAGGEALKIPATIKSAS